jgi:hypothetical protein
MSDAAGGPGEAPLTGLTPASSAHPRLQFPGGLAPGTLVRRYKRFLADVLMAAGPAPKPAAAAPRGATADAAGAAAGAGGGDATVVHCPNTGPMAGVIDV